MRSAILLTSVLALAACNVSGHARDNGDSDDGPVGPTIKRAYALSGFEKIELSGSHDVIVTVGPAVSVNAEGDASSLDRMEILVENGTLKVRSKRRKGGWFDSDHRGGRHVIVRVTMPSIAAASIEGSGDIKVDKVERDRFSGAVAGSGDLDLGAMKVGEAAFSIAGSGAIRARGTSDSAAMSIAGSGDVDAAALETKRVKVSIAGSGDVRTRAMETADISIMGSGDVTVDGPAKCTISKMGSGDVHCTGS
jgi:hypothetical protein